MKKGMFILLSTLCMAGGCADWSLPEPCAPYVRAAYEKAKTGDKSAQYELGSYLQRGDGVPEPDVSGAVYWYQKSSAQGCVPAKNNLANLYLSGNESVRDEERGRELLYATENAGGPENEN